MFQSYNVIIYLANKYNNLETSLMVLNFNSFQWTNEKKF